MGFVLFLAAWYLCVDVFALPRFRALPGPVEVFGAWMSTDPTYGTSLFTGMYWASERRVALSFAAALAADIPLDRSEPDSCRAAWVPGRWTCCAPW